MKMPRFKDHRNTITFGAALKKIDLETVSNAERGLSRECHVYRWHKSIFQDRRGEEDRYGYLSTSHSYENLKLKDMLNFDRLLGAGRWI